MNAKIHLGTCAWSYDDWRGAFYPQHLPQHDWLEFYARHFGAVEVDSTFYHAPGERAVAHWHGQTPAHFRFACKVPRAITHELRLRDSQEKMEAFLDSLAPLSEKLGCVLIQLPPGFSIRQDESALRDFVRHLPPQFRYAVEFRKHEWHLPRIVHLFEQHRICWVWNDISALAEQNRAPFEFLPQTTDFLYVRLMGDLAHKYRADGSRIFQYTQMRWPRDSALESWTVKIQRHAAESSEVFIFASNHFEGFAPATCQRIGQRFNIGIKLPSASSPKAAQAGKNPQLELL